MVSYKSVNLKNMPSAFIYYFTFFSCSRLCTYIGKDCHHTELIIFAMFSNLLFDFYN